MESVEAREPQPNWWDGRDRANLSWLSSNFPCRSACPVGTNAGGYVSLIAQGCHEEAYALARGPNPLASICGRVCAHPCESACRRGAIDEPISIRALKRVVTERFGVESAADFRKILGVVERPRPPATRPGRVGVVGAGPAGLSCAHDLALMGHQVTIYDAAPVAGGMMRLGIPEYRLPREVLECEIEFVRFLGVELRLEFDVGRDAPFERFVQDHDAVFLAVGCRRGQPLDIPGGDLAGVLHALAFLAHVNLGVRVDIGERVVVVGGGNVAFDVARSAWRHEGAPPADDTYQNLSIDAATVASRILRRKDVSIIYRRSREEMPVAAEEITEAVEEGIDVRFLTAPVEILGNGGRVAGVRCLRMALGEPDASGRRRPVPIPGSEHDIEADTVIPAIGQAADLSFLGTDHGISVTPGGTIRVDRSTLATSREGVYAGGDVAFGPRIIIDAVADGRRAAKAIDTFLTGRTDSPRALGIRVFDTFGYDHPFARGDYEKVPRIALPHIPVQVRTQRVEVERLLDEGVARTEGSRCLHCWVNTIFDSSRLEGSECIQCGGCVDVCPEQCIDLVSLIRVARRPDGQGVSRLPNGEPIEALDHPSGAALIKDETACIRCGLCARRCPVGLITMQAFHRDGEESFVGAAERVL